METHYVSPRGGKATFEGEQRQCRTLAELSGTKLRRGAVVQLVPGDYAIGDPILIQAEPGDGNDLQRIVVRGAPGVTLRGRAMYPPRPEMPAPYTMPWAALVFDKVDGLLVERIDFEQCWPNAILLHGCSRVVVAHCNVRHGTNFIFARSADDAPPSRGFKIHDVVWEQDPDQLLWQGAVTWCQVKQSGPDDCSRRQIAVNRQMFNGALFHARKLLGDVEIHDCTVRNAFNGIRLVGEPPDPDGRKPFAVNNADVRIRDNVFFQIRDNVIEPEKYAYNWWVFRNEIVGSYATFSFDGLRGDYFYYFGNRCRIASPHRDTDGTFPGDTGIPHYVGHSFKFYSDTATGAHFYAFHNSIHTCYPYAKEGATAHWLDCNNAVEFAHMAPHLTDPHFFRTDGSHNGQVTAFTPGAGCRFRGMLSNYLNFPGSVAAYAVEGVHCQPVFARGPNGEWTFDLDAGSPGRGASVAERIELVDGTSFTLARGMDIGAVQGRTIYRGPGFVPFLHQAGV